LGDGLWFRVYGGGYRIDWVRVDGSGFMVEGIGLIGSGCMVQGVLRAANSPFGRI